ncbi:Ada metal-binding domain-containing protein [Spirosoma areae]
MIGHMALGPTRFAQLRALVTMVNSEAIRVGGHRPGKIYGTLTCRVGKRMKSENRVFFQSETDAIAHGYRPCAVCLPEKYKVWKGNR